MRIKKPDGSATKIELLAGMDVNVDGVWTNNKYKDDLIEVWPIASLWIVFRFRTIGMTVVFDYSKSGALFAKVFYDIT